MTIIGAPELECSGMDGMRPPARAAPRSIASKLMLSANEESASVETSLYPEPNPRSRSAEEMILRMREWYAWRSPLLAASRAARIDASILSQIFQQIFRRWDVRAHPSRIPVMMTCDVEKVAC